MGFTGRSHADVGGGNVPFVSSEVVGVMAIPSPIIKRHSKAATSTLDFLHVEQAVSL